MTHSNGMLQFPFLMNNQFLVGNKKAIYFSNQDDNYEVGNPDDAQLNDDLQIDVLPGDMLNSSQDQAVLQNEGHSQVNTSTLPQHCDNTSIHRHPSKNPLLKLLNHSILMLDYLVDLHFKWHLLAYVIVIEQT